jgi:hypothetical protein
MAANAPLPAVLTSYKCFDLPCSQLLFSFIGWFVLAIDLDYYY